MKLTIEHTCNKWLMKKMVTCTNRRCYHWRTGKMHTHSQVQARQTRWHALHYYLLKRPKPVKCSQITANFHIVNQVCYRKVGSGEKQHPQISAINNQVSRDKKTHPKLTFKEEKKNSSAMVMQQRAKNYMLNFATKMFHLHQLWSEMVTDRRDKKSEVLEHRKIRET